MLPLFRFILIHISCGKPVELVDHVDTDIHVLPIPGNNCEIPIHFPRLALHSQFLPTIIPMSGSNGTRMV